MLEVESLGREWATLQHDYEQYEKGGLLIKLFAIALCMAGFAFSLLALPLVLSLFALWLQEAIFRTFQARLGARIQRIEKALAENVAIIPFQLHAEWQASRPGTRGLLAEYTCAALRPTVAFPHVLLLILVPLWLPVG